jgi:CRISPR-associated protein Csx3
MTTYSITSTMISAPAAGVLLKMAFGAPAQNDQIVKDAVAALEELKLAGGELVLLNGPASLPVAAAVAHGVSHRYGSVACFDPKLAAYVVSVSHNPERPVGSLIPSSEVR